MGFYDVLNAVGQGAKTGLQTYDTLTQRNRQQQIEDQEREERQRLGVIERALLELEYQRAKEPEKPSYEVNVDGMRGSFRSPQEAADFRNKYRTPEKPPEPDLPYGANVDGLSARFATPDEAAAFRDRYRVPEQEGPASLPAGVQQAMANNRAQVSRIDQVIQAIQARPQSLGARYALLPEMVSQRTDPEGVSVRAMLADIGSMVILQRSGAAVAVQEMERLKPFIPAASDTPEAAIIKLRQLQQGIQQVLDETGGTVAQVDGQPSTPPAQTGVGPLRTGYQPMSGPTTSKPAWQRRADELRASGMSPDQIAATLRQEGLVSAGPQATATAGPRPFSGLNR
jgi:hypothetical protein